MTKYKTDNISSSHLSSDDLLRYYRHLQTEDERLNIEKHLKGCELCADAMKGIAEMHDAMHIYNITHELKKRIKKRVTIRRKIFSGMDLLSIVMVFFILGLLLLFTFYFLYFKK